MSKAEQPAVNPDLWTTKIYGDERNRISATRILIPSIPKSLRKTSNIPEFPISYQGSRNAHESRLDLLMRKIFRVPDTSL